MQEIHATCVALPSPIGPLGLLLLGAPGSGKSDLALRLVDAGGWLVADDRVRLEAQEGLLQARPLPGFEGLVALRGLGLAQIARLESAPVALAVRLQPGAGLAADAEPLPEESAERIAGCDVPVIALDPAAASAVPRIRLALTARAAALAKPAEPPGRRAPLERRGGPLPVVLVTGMSGAGRTTALKVLEDLGYEAIDNLPLNLLARAVTEGELGRAVAIGADVRNRNFAAGPLLEQLGRLEADPALKVTLLFVDCDDEVLQRRFTETRRRHPLAEERPLADGIAAERRLLAPLRERADVIIDTSSMALPEFRRSLAERLALAQGPRMGVFVTSFSFRVGLPREADLVFDVRFLRNPHYDAALRPLTGRDAAVADYVAADAAFAPFFQSLTGLLQPLLPRYEAEGKSYLTIAIGCTGGRHRSVATAEKLAHWLAVLGWPVGLVHRDLDRGQEGKAPA
ncbi:RNase adaptor protein for sRNA GlmZ degradation, contains a P-loop ATPase domain [Tistlia consotensis]|uniref:RNase adaptor protein for sRNA GlmZ degradation, contains a P-loop ATPase domain n=1 Tax=Tistlia consotensis USBA 355 TaxID=560819 RepID=A0A1Y6CHN9_9PROT|nr:RNase adapter RapZ [Tistlia consotensis]SMF62713.1 RNase adaptor protein for sRNA GlmZ degradation, contains a P-loop ATPase domain [Tistlia consotensis USBA 355]SNR95091.1 RNase adaptor protein for sRNA GlmZ degradation, contains a P-loop ATPase domain [Tistlia consotensis]